VRGALPGFVSCWALGIHAVDRAAGLVAPETLLDVCRGLALFALAAGAVSKGRMRLLCAGCVAAALGGHALAARFADAAWTLPEGRSDVVLEATVARVTPAGPDVRFDLERLVVAESHAQVPPRARLFVRSPVRGFAGLIPGDRLRARVRLRRVVGRSNPGSGDSALRLRRAGVAAWASPVHPDLQVRIERGGRLQALQRSFYERRLVAAGRLRDAKAALAGALALGDRSGLSEADQEAFRALGLAHLLAVSGLHVALVGGLGFAAARRALLLSPGAMGRDPRRAAWVAAWSAAALYGLLAGWGVPVRRALVFGVAIGAGFAMRRPVSRGAPVALAAWAILAVEPGALFEPGAQLSFAAAAALQFARRPGDAPLRGRLGGLREGLGVSALALAATAPLAAWHFGRAAPLGLVTNLLAVPLTAAVLLPGSLLAAALAFVPGESAAVAWLLEALGTGSEALLGALRGVAARLPPEASRSPAGGAGIACSVACALLAVRARSLRARVVWVLVGAAALGAFEPTGFVPARPRVVALDVGQGDAAFVQGSAGTILVDAGSPGRGRDVVLPALRAAGIRRVDLVVLTHADLDHRGGLLEVLGGVRVDRLWVPRGAATDRALAPVLAAASAAGVRVAERGAGDLPLRIGELRVTPLWPAPCAAAPTGGGCTGGRRNDRSLVVRVDAPSGRVLFPGDLEAGGERALLESGADLRAEVLLLPHHGSRSSSSASFIRAVAPEVALASAPCLGRFEMPAPEVRARVREIDARLHWTGRSGAVLVRLGRPSEVRGWRATPLDFCR
jgi:competence protein ComEC